MVPLPSTTVRYEQQSWKEPCRCDALEALDAMICWVCVLVGGPDYLSAQQPGMLASERDDTTRVRTAPPTVAWRKGATTLGTIPYASAARTSCSIVTDGSTWITRRSCKWNEVGGWNGRSDGV